jgi:hypothetical protein
VPRLKARIGKVIERPSPGKNCRWAIAGFRYRGRRMQAKTSMRHGSRDAQPSRTKVHVGVRLTRSVARPVASCRDLSRRFQMDEGAKNDERFPGVIVNQVSSFPSDLLNVFGHSYTKTTGPAIRPPDFRINSVADREPVHDRMSSGLILVGTTGFEPATSCRSAYNFYFKRLNRTRNTAFGGRSLNFC